VSVSLEVDLFPDAREMAHFSERNTIMATGTVKWFNTTKGFGFIQPDDGSKDVFLHISDVQRAGMEAPQEGDKLSYELQHGQQGKTSATALKAA
jgi:CspA family cold shock protein